PCSGRPRIKHLRELGVMLVNSIPRTLSSIASADTDISRKAADARSPAIGSLSGAEVNICRAFEDIPGATNIAAYQRVRIRDKVIQICIVLSASTPVEPSFNPPLCVL